MMSSVRLGSGDFCFGLLKNLRIAYLRLAQESFLNQVLFRPLPGAHPESDRIFVRMLRHQFATAVVSSRIRSASIRSPFTNKDAIPFILALDWLIYRSRFPPYGCRTAFYGIGEAGTPAAVDEVYDVLRQAIVSYALKPGERLNIDELAQKLGVSLTPVRNAIQKLSAEGFIEIRSRSGTFVASLSARDVDETFRIRCALECLAAQDGIAALHGKHMNRMKELLKTMRKPVRNAEAQTAHESANWEFHQIIVRSSGNRRLVEMYEALNAHIKIARIHSSESSWATRVSKEQTEHEAILAAIEAGAGTSFARHCGRTFIGRKMRWWLRSRNSKRAANNESRVARQGWQLRSGLGGLWQPIWIAGLAQ